MKTTYEKVLNFRLNAQRYLSVNQKSKDGSKTVINKFMYALQKMLSRTKDLQKKYDEYIEDNRIEFASEDGSKNLIIDDKNRFNYTKENQKKLNIAVRTKLEETVEVDPYIVAPADNLSYGEMEVFEGFVVESMAEPTETEKPKENTEN